MGNLLSCTERSKSKSVPYANHNGNNNVGRATCLVGQCHNSVAENQDRKLHVSQSGNHVCLYLPSVETSSAVGDDLASVYSDAAISTPTSLGDSVVAHPGEIMRDSSLKSTSSTRSLFNRFKENASNYFLDSAHELDDDSLRRILACFPFPSPRSSPHNSRKQPASSAGGFLSASTSNLANVAHTDAHQPDLQRSANSKLQLSTSSSHHLLVQPSEKPAAAANKSHRTTSSPPSKPKKRSSARNRFARDKNLRLQNTKSEVLPSSTSPIFQALCLNAVELTATAVSFDINWLRNRLKKFQQISGHEGTIVPATEKTLWKKCVGHDSNEACAYRKLMRDVVHPLVPKFFKEVVHRSEYFIEIEDLCHHFEEPAIMDVKLGTRTFLESEVTNPVTRRDLYDKMMQIDPNEPTADEHAEKAITKLRYMQFRERESSSSTLGFRIDAIKLPGKLLVKDFKKVKTQDQVAKEICKFFAYKFKLQDALLSRLKEMRQKIEISEFFRTHEVIGSSLLIILDDARPGAWMIDFAKALPSPVPVDHRTPWSLGNHEDGYLMGLDNFIQLLEESKFCELSSLESDEGVSMSVHSALSAA